MHWAPCTTRNGYLDLRVALWIALGILFGAWLGANLALRIPTRDLQHAFAVFICFVAGHLWFSARWRASRSALHEAD
ncbi:MAG: sulfite exporter TauE/SafE family protein [Gemmatimonadota bacterium]